jgi:hypothetical protein
MSRRNESRVNPVNDAPTPPNEVMDKDPSSMLSFVMPTEIVELPSGGVLYPEGHPLCGKQSVEIKYMTAKEEDILTSKSLITKGIVLDRLISSIMLDDVSPDDLLVGDRNAILVAARVTGYGSDYEVSVGCAHCGANFSETFDLSALDSVQEPDLEENDVELRDGLYYMQLPMSKVTVGLRPLFGKDEKIQAAAEKKKKKYNLPDSSLTDMLKSIIVSANGSDDKTLIAKFIDMMPAQDSRILRSTYTKIIPDVDMSQVVTCPECGTGSVVEVPFTGEFFWPSK